jgi:hypothetical protein
MNTGKLINFKSGLRDERYVEVELKLNKSTNQFLMKNGLEELELGIKISVVNILTIKLLMTIQLDFQRSMSTIKILFLV